MSVIDIEEWPAKVQSTLLLECLYIKLGALPCGSAGKESACNAGDLGLIPGLGRSPEGDMATHSSVLAWGILMDSGAWWAAVHGVAKSQTRLSD